MAESPQPSTVHEGASTPPPPTGTAEDRKAAAALSNLDNNAGEEDDKRGGAVDAEALGKAMQGLSVAKDPKAGDTKAEVKKVKIKGEDVNVVVSFPGFPPPFPLF
jgi:hypothetical protein